MRLNPGVITDLLGDIDGICGVRDDIGADLKTVFLVTRTWSGDEPGEGTKVDVSAKMLPSPRVVEYGDSYKIKDGGAVQQGDILVKMISKGSFPTRADVDCSTDSAKIEKFYQIDDIFYRVIDVKEKYLTWNVQIRRVTPK